jgi:hypothetical protein
VVIGFVTALLGLDGPPVIAALGGVSVCVATAGLAICGAIDTTRVALLVELRRSVSVQETLGTSLVMLEHAVKRTGETRGGENIAGKA